jgi:hypothetical protein
MQILVEIGSLGVDVSDIMVAKTSKGDIVHDDSH